MIARFEIVEKHWHFGLFSILPGVVKERRNMHSASAWPPETWPPEAWTQGLFSWHQTSRWKDTVSFHRGEPFSFDALTAAPFICRSTQATWNADKDNVPRRTRPRAEQSWWPRFSFALAFGCLEKLKENSRRAGNSGGSTSKMGHIGIAAAKLEQRTTRQQANRELCFSWMFRVRPRAGLPGGGVFIRQNEKPLGRRR
jgi:hypothetical protein